MEYGYKRECVCVHVCESACVCGWMDMCMWEDGWVCVFVCVSVCVCKWVDIHTGRVVGCVCVVCVCVVCVCTRVRASE